MEYIIYNCLYCSTPKKVYAAKYKNRKPPKFCSYSCRNKYCLTGKFGEGITAWKGGRRHNSDGYIYLRIEGKDILEHRKIMQEYLGRSLNPREHVHHKNGVKDDNRLENLEIMDIRKHMSHERKIRPLKKDLVSGKFVHN